MHFASLRGISIQTRQNLRLRTYRENIYSRRINLLSLVAVTFIKKMKERYVFYPCIISTFCMDAVFSKLQMGANKADLNWD